MLKIFASGSSEIEPREIRHNKMSRTIANECMVLLENDGTLPLKKVKNIAVFGNGVRNTVKGGTGSGDVYARESINIEQGFINAGLCITTNAWLDRQDEMLRTEKEVYFAWVEKEAKRKGGSVFSVSFDNPFCDPAPVRITKKDCESADTDTAVYVISRNSGEGGDRYYKEGDYLLYSEEENNLRTIAKLFRHTIVILNIGGLIDLSGIKAIEGINSILLMTQLGAESGNAVVDVLTGKAVPSGKTADTWAKKYMDYPSSEEFSHNGSVNDEFYTDGIYVGYRYFDSFGVEPEYCFGYGLSYTDFSIETTQVQQENDRIHLKVKVTNIGNEYAGKEVVQIYYSAPEGTLDKPWKELVAYKKTSLLYPGDTEILDILFKIENMASYSPEDAAWVLEKGSYLLRVGNSSDNTKVDAVLKLEQKVETEKLKNLFPMDQKFDEICPQHEEWNSEKENTVFTIEINAENLDEKHVNYVEKRTPFPVAYDRKIMMDDIKNGECTVEELVSQLTVEEMAEMCIGALRLAEGNIVGNSSQMIPGAAADTSFGLVKTRGIRSLVLADGPAGLRLLPNFKVDSEGNMVCEKGSSKLHAVHSASCQKGETIDYYQYCTAIPIGWALAQSWNDDLVEEAGNIIGREMEQFHVDLWLAPAMNIHRNPLCGRNFEYYSEDPLLTGKIAAAMVRGVQSYKRKGTTIKHFAANNQEDNRYFLNVHASERTLREIYLKGFEIAIKESRPVSVMTSFNLINGVHTANSFDLLQSVARDEWGFKGIFMTDWYASQNIPNYTGKYEHHYPISSSAGCISAGNDIQMPGCQKNVDDIVEAVKTGQEKDGYIVTLADLQFTTANIIRLIAELS